MPLMRLLTRIPDRAKTKTQDIQTGGRGMTDKEAFGLVIRAGGIYLLWKALDYVFYSCFETAGLVPTEKVASWVWCLRGFYYYAGGVVFLKYANRITEFVYKFEKAEG
jgi:hypothetical protein